MAYFGVLTTFDHNLQDWKSYKSRITQWFVANEITDATGRAGCKRRAVLLSALAQATFQLAADLALSKNIEEVPFEDILNFLDAHFNLHNTKSIGFSERHIFYAAWQQVGETHSQWAARLRGLTSRCAFANVEEALRDRFIMGMLPGLEKQKLCAQDLGTLTLAKALEFVENVHSASLAATASGCSPNVKKTHLSDPVYKVMKGTKKNNLVCGYTNHTAAECHYANFVCKKCNVKVYLRRMCASKINYVNNGAEDEEIGDDGKDFSTYSVG